VPQYLEHAECRVTRIVGSFRGKREQILDSALVLVIDYSLQVRHPQQAFGDEALRHDGRPEHIRPDLLDKVRTILAQLSEARTIEDMGMTSFHLHPLKGDMKGFWSVTVRANWRIVFRFADGDADAVELTDYH